MSKNKQIIPIEAVVITQTPIGYLVVMLVWVGILKSGLLHEYLGVYGSMIFPLGLCIIGFSYGYKDLRHYLPWRGTASDKFLHVIFCWFLGGLACMAVWWLFGNLDAQNLSRLVIPVSQWGIQVIDCVLTGIGEECFKLLLFLSAFRLLLDIGWSRQMSFWIGIVIISLFFGSLHMNYNQEMGLAITLGIGAGAVVEFYLLFLYRSIIPIMIAHSLQDAFTISCKVEGIGGLVESGYDMLLSIGLIVFVAWQGIKKLAQFHQQG